MTYDKENLDVVEEEILAPKEARWYNVYAWSKKRWLAAALVLFVILAAIIVPLIVSRSVRYPVYTRLTYTLNDTYEGEGFFDMFDYGNGTERTNGFVNYVTKEGAAYSNLTYASSQSATLRVDHRVNTTAGRPSVKIMSKHNYTRGLFIFDVLHSPWGCGTWPALWLTDEDNWPAHGEIDVMESVNQGNLGNQMTLHTTDDCHMTSRRKQTGKTISTNCLNSTNHNQGCSVRGPLDTFGDNFNAFNGGIYAMEWRKEGIRVWFFPRTNIPADIKAQQPDPGVWGEALADFPSTGCDMDTHFRNHKIVVNVNLCGDWAGKEHIYTDQDQCPGVCSEFVGAHPEAFMEAYWEFKSFRVYTADGF